MKQLIRLLVFLLASVICMPSFAGTYGKVTGISIDGLHHVAYEQVAKAISIRKHHVLTDKQVTETISHLYKLGYFSDVKIRQARGHVNIEVIEQPYINRVRITGIKLIPEEKLAELQKALHLVDGSFYHEANISAFVLSMKQAYDSLGYYNARFNINKKMRAGHSCDLMIKVKEGAQAKIRQINIIGNKTFSKKTLINLISLRPSSLWAMVMSSDKYAKQKLDADIETLRSYYMDHGFMNFKVDEVTVSMTPDKKSIMITIHLVEGDQYTIGHLKIVNPLPEYNEKIKKLLRVQEGELFARARLLDDASKIKQMLGDHGYANAVVEPEPKVEEKAHKMDVIYRIKPGKKVTVRRIEFFGNTVTDTLVLRRELRQFEGSEFALDKIKESERRLSNIKWLKDIKMLTEPVSGHEDEVDLHYHFKEQSSAQIMAEASYSEMTGFVYRFSLNQDNFLGTGRSTSVSTSHSKSSNSFNISYFDPYFTQDGISHRLGFYKTETKPGRVALSDYVRNILGLDTGFGYALSDYVQVSFGFLYEADTLIGGGDPAREIANFVDLHGTNFDQFEVTGAIGYNSFDNATWPKNGLDHRVSLRYALPATDSSLHYYKAKWSIGYYYSMPNDLILNGNASFAYGNGFGNTGNLPFFEHYYAGGIGSVAGYDAYSLGPKDSKNRSHGGNTQVLGSINLIFPNNLGENVRTALFINTGNVYDDHIDFSELRSSFGLSLTWKSVIGPLEFVFAKPINKKAGDQTRSFDFAVGFGI